jgi:hypothetical protein
VDGNGNRILPRGAARANQVGGVEDALSEFDAQVSSFLSFNTTDRARNVVDNSFNRAKFQARDTTAQMALSKRLATGGVVTARSQTLYSFNNIPTINEGLGNLGRVVPSDYTQILEAQVLHPLMRNRGTLVNRIPVVLARINEDVSLVQFEERVRNLVRDVEYAYWDLYQAYWNVENARIARDSAAQAYHIAHEKSKKGLASTTEAQARVTYHEFQAQLDAALGGSNLQGQDPGLFGREQQLRLLLDLRGQIAFTRCQQYRKLRAGKHCCRAGQNAFIRWKRFYGFIKKTQKTPPQELELALKRKKPSTRCLDN